jgi:anaerobic selenocysteine-containing dehydrogenase
MSFPNRERLEDALGRLDLLVVQDGFETPTTALADVVLPAAIWGEKDGTFTNTERRASQVRKAVEPPGEARSDFDIVLALAERFGGLRQPPHQQRVRPDLPGAELQAVRRPGREGALALLAPGETSLMTLPDQGESNDHEEREPCHDADPLEEAHPGRRLACFDLGWPRRGE